VFIGFIVHECILIFPFKIDLRQIAEDHKNIAGDGLAISQRSLSIQQKEHDQKLSEKQAKVLQLFRLTKSTEDATYEWYKERTAERLEGTCMWFLNHPHFQEWQRKASGPLLVSADPGCGKTVLAKYLIDHVLPRSSTVCYFFFKDQVQNTVREALCALLHQLFSQKQYLLVHAMEQYGKDGPGLMNSTSSLWNIFGNAVQDSSARSVTIVLDALDECADSEMKDLMRNMEIQVRNSESYNGKLKVIMTTRPYEHIVPDFHDLFKASPSIHIPGEDELDAIGQEVNCVIRHRVDQFVEKRRLSDEVKTCLQDQLLRMEHRTYLWVYLVFEYLEEHHFKRTVKGLASTFDALPKSVNQAYEQILNKSKDRPMVQKVLAIILAATRPLALSEMSVAMEVDEETKSINDLDLEHEQDFKSSIRSWCGLFVSIHHGKIYFLHQTAREFLVAEQSSPNAVPQQGRSWHGFITMQDAHTVLAECCVRFISLYDRLTTDQVDEFQSNAFLHYSAQFWTLHLRESSICEDEDAAIAPLAFNLSDPNTEVYAMWWAIYKYSIRGYLKCETWLMAACYFGHVASVKRALAMGADVNDRGVNPSNALYAASSKGHEQIVKLLLNNGADANRQRNQHGTALVEASANGYEQIIQLLLNNGADVNAMGSGYGYGTALIAASANGYEQIIKLLLNNGADVNALGSGYKYGTALIAASANGYEQIVKFLLNNGADINSQSYIYGTALVAASANGYEQVVKLLLDQGADNNAQSGSYGDALKEASAKGHEQVVELLRDRGADVNAKSEDLDNALYKALSS
jgi:ankyrin repeat protein